MATQRPGLSVPLTEFAAALLAEREVAPRARITAQQIAEIFPGMGVVVYTLEEGEAGKQWTPKAKFEISLNDPSVPFESGTLGAMAERNEPVVFAGSDLAREDYAHLNVRQTLTSIAALPLSVNDQLIGAIEVISVKEKITEESLAAMAQVAECASIGIATAIAYEGERNDIGTGKYRTELADDSWSCHQADRGSGKEHRPGHPPGGPAIQPVLQALPCG